MAPQDFDNLQPRVHPWNDAINQIGTIKSPNQHCGIVQMQLLSDVGAHTCRRGGGVGMETGARKARLELGEAAVFRAEIVAPVTDAVRFIDSEGWDLNTLDELQKTRREQPLRRHEQQPVTSGSKTLLCFMDSMRRHACGKSRPRKHAL